MLTIQKLPENKPVCLLGFAPSRHGVGELAADIEIWSVNDCWHHFDRFERVIEVHQWDYLNDPAYYANHETTVKHLAWLKQPHDFPIYMTEKREEVPSSVRYPIEHAITLADSNYFASSFAYLIALAILEERNPIYIYGFDMATSTEWFYQRPNAEWWIGRAQGMGFDVRIAEYSPLCKASKLYGYEGGQMIDRQIMESQVRIYKEQMKTATEQFERWQGILMERHRLKRNKAEIDEAAIQVRGFERTQAQCEGAILAIQFLIDECDLVPVTPIKYHPGMEDVRDLLEVRNEKV